MFIEIVLVTTSSSASAPTTRRPNPLRSPGARSAMAPLLDMTWATSLFPVERVDEVGNRLGRARPKAQQIGPVEPDNGVVAPRFG